jgi:hypothetical protein
MIRTRKIINKSDIFNYVGNENISKVEILTSKQKTLKNPDVVSVYIYYRVNWNDICSIIGRCVEFNKQKRSTSNEDFDFVANLYSVKSAGFITLSALQKLLNIEKKYNFSFNISKKLKTIFPELIFTKHINNEDSLILMNQMFGGDINKKQ